MSSADALREKLERIGIDAGLDRVGCCSAEPFHDVRVTLESRKQQGLHSDMQFTYRNPTRSTDPSRTLPGARTLIVGARSYRRDGEAQHDEHSAGRAAIAQYVWEPHYEKLRFALDAMADRLRTDGFSARVVVDDNALVDRAAAYRAGIGWWGKNSNILVPGIGSKVVLGSIITDAVFASVDEPMADQCGPCRRCIDACPTDAIVADGVIDANRCLAWLVQSPGVFPTEFRTALGDRIYGCDDCQTSCPPNLVTDRRDPPPQTTGATAVDVAALLEADDEALLDRFGAWYIPRREVRYLRRNALVILGNVGSPDSPEVRALVERYLASDDEIERSHAVWTAHKLGYDDLSDRVAGDPNALVAAEAAAAGWT